MREIKFRGWDGRGNRMINSIFLNSADQGSLPVGGDWNDVVNLDNLRIMQYTGLKDKNGKEIYEGDIVLRSWGITIAANKRIEEVKDMGFELKLSIIESGGITEVIGNIYENPELLK